LDECKILLQDEKKRKIKWPLEDLNSKFALIDYLSCALKQIATV
tara:strand:- start:1145 stop:1276 length:132 start_codon:yes stop_codon:yes gene_type:complete